ncbi:MAG: DUF494 family protein [Bacteroidetes bacterium]|nr:DUF494 family protein [Bacteroidota bacterium]
MQEKIIEIIVYILSEIKNRKQIGDIDLKKLAKIGYTESEINTAFAWIYSRINQGENIFKGKKRLSKSKRFFHDIEKDILTTDAMGYLISLFELGLLSDTDDELIFDKIFYSGFEIIGKAELKILLASIILDLDNKSDKLDRLVLQNNDTIH